MSDEGENVEGKLRGLCYGGEQLGEVVRVGEAGVAVTSHRVLVLDPDGEPRFREVALPNVIDARPNTDGDTGVAIRALQRGVYAVALFAVSVRFDFGAIASDFLGVESVPSAQGVGRVTAIVQAIVRFLGVLDDLLGLAGLALALVALLHAIRYARSRERILELDVSGGDSIRVPIERGETEAAGRVGDAVDRAKEALEET